MKNLFPWQLGWTPLLLLNLFPNLSQAEPQYEAQLIFPLESWHNHGSCIVQTQEETFWLVGSMVRGKKVG